jgi:glucose/arabinose dehydrogenase
MLNLLSALTALLAILPQAFSQTCTNINPAQPATFASGYSGRVLLNGLKNPRGIIFDNQGNILTTEQAAYGVRYITLTDNGGTNVCVKSSKQLISDSSINHGIALTPDGKTLFVSSLTTVWSWSYDGTTGTVSNKKVVIQNMRNGGFHLSRTLLVPKASPDTLLVQRGSDGNIDTPAAEIGTARSQIRAFSIAAIQSAAVDYTKGEVLGWGLRNTVGMGEDPRGGIWSVDNGVDDMTRDGKDIHHTNPCEELNYHGVVSNTSDSVRGGHFGYPDCFAVWDPTVLPGSLAQTLTVGQPFVIGTSPPLPLDFILY